jgi:hypothetical protein
MGGVRGVVGCWVMCVVCFECMLLISMVCLLEGRFVFVVVFFGFDFYWLCGLSEVVLRKLNA